MHSIHESRNLYDKESIQEIRKGKAQATVTIKEKESLNL